MFPPNPANIVKTAAGVAGGSALIAPVAVPTLHGLAGVIVVGAGVFAVGSLVVKAAGAIKDLGNQLKPKGEGN
jgi:hypothetical protein